MISREKWELIKLKLLVLQEKQNRIFNAIIERRIDIELEEIRKIELENSKIYQANKIVGSIR